jgi:hypothetical protein
MGVVPETFTTMLNGCVIGERNHVQAVENQMVMKARIFWHGWCFKGRVCN